MRFCLLRKKLHTQVNCQCVDILHLSIAKIYLKNVKVSLDTVNACGQHSQYSFEVPCIIPLSKII